MGKIIIEVPIEGEKEFKLENKEDFEKLEKILKRLYVRKHFDEVVGSIEVEENIDEDDIYLRGKY